LSSEGKVGMNKVVSNAEQRLSRIKGVDKLKALAGGHRVHMGSLSACP